jgi:hypothetical protein
MVSVSVSGGIGGVLSKLGAELGPLSHNSQAFTGSQSLTADSLIPAECSTSAGKLKTCCSCMRPEGVIYK